MGRCGCTIRGFAERFATPHFDRRLRALRRELKRRTDIETATPFSPYNLRLYRTHYGLRDVIALLVRSDLVRVYDEAADRVPRLIETAPLLRSADEVVSALQRPIERTTRGAPDDFAITPT
jgi:hypothetical protein